MLVALSFPIIYNHSRIPSHCIRRIKSQQRGIFKTQNTIEIGGSIDYKEGVALIKKIRIAIC